MPLSAPGAVRILGIDPGLRATGWGILDMTGNRMTHVADGVLLVSPKLKLSDRLAGLFEGLARLIEQYQPGEAAVEETFATVNGASTLKLGQARGIALLAPALAGLEVAEYAANLVKKSVTGVGHADKAQVQNMVLRLLPGAVLTSADAADALAVAICHAHHRATARRMVPAA
ncbi:MAG: crossover junction endodeoxyribonuclease RuvC [Alphaproteobacteria bacterium]|nr:crossover junction endodeoxyribonuclease RuvC [Alphaproteobacteria bacterium]